MRTCLIPLRAIAIGLLSLGTAEIASAQFYGGGANMAPQGSQPYARGLAGSGPVNGGNFSYAGGWGATQPGTQVATPWSSQNGAWIQPASSYWVQNDIASQQAHIQGKMQNQDYELRRLQLKRAAFDEMQYEKMNTPPAEVAREEQRLENLARARNTPPLEEIANGDALNSLLTNIQRIQARDGVTGAAIPLDQDTVSKINVTTTGNLAGSNEFFKPGSFPEWPYAFEAASFSADKARIQTNLEAMAKAQIAGKIDLNKTADARRTVDALKAKLFGVRSTTGFNDYVAALDFLSKLSNTIDTLGKAGAKNFLDGTYAAKGNSVAELVNSMISKGLKFSQATPGYEPYYSTLYQQLVTYEIGLSRMVGQQTSLVWPPPQRN
jgi:hypothetical protein